MVILLPQPKSVKLLQDKFSLAVPKTICITSNPVQDLLFSARRIQTSIESATGFEWSVAAGWAVPLDEQGLVIRVSPGEMPHTEGYRLSIAQKRIEIVGNNPAGVFYGVCTLIQLLQQAQSMQLDGQEITDWPDFQARGVMLDISRDKVYRMETLYALIDRLASWKINQVQLYTEHTFAYRNHAEVWAEASPITGEEILLLDAYCRERFIELVPNQNLFGHMERWLKHPRYAHLAEIHGEFPVPWGTMRGPFSLAPANPGSLELARSLLDELLPHFSSRMVNIGCDETFDVGYGQSKVLCEERGKGRVYLDYLKQLYADVSRRGFRTQFWGDIINDHPELVPELPGDMIGLLWGYEAEFPFAQQGERFARAGVPFYVCPGTSSWNTIAGRTQNSLGNLRNAAENGLKFGASGYLNTDWGDNGHWQALPISYLGFLAGAAYAWNFEGNKDVDFAPALSLFAFEDRSGAMGRLAYDLGNAYLNAGVTLHNSNVFHRLMSRSMQEIVATRGANHYTMHAAMESIEKSAAHMKHEQMTCGDAALVRREFANTVRMLKHACRRWEVAFEEGKTPPDEAKQALRADLADILEEYRSIWLERNRSGGLADSMARFDKARKDVGLL